jgi:hypothetical protein
MASNNSSNIRQRLSRVFVWLKTFIELAAALATLAAVGVLGVLGSLLAGHRGAALIFAGMTLVALALAAIQLYVFHRRFDSLEFRRGYRWRRAEMVYSIDKHDPSHHSLRVTVELQAIRPGVSLFEDRYWWSGHGEDENLEALRPPTEVLGPVRQSEWKYFYVPLGRELAVGETITVVTRQKLVDSGGTFQPFFAKTVVEPLDSLTLKVELPEGRVHVESTEYDGVGPGSRSLRPLDHRYDHSAGEILLDVSSPVVGHRYEVRWSP